jgi:2-succinyl-5-enolpyruvyl-6-hydroxy-3-cyclohexene-1-carboxylate synthase
MAFCRAPGKICDSPWTGGAPEVSLIVQSYQAGASMISATCEAPSELGTMTIPSAVLEAVRGAQLVVLSARNHVFQAGLYGVKIRLATDATVPNKSRRLTIKVSVVD